MSVCCLWLFWGALKWSCYEWVSLEFFLGRLIMQECARICACACECACVCQGQFHVVMILLLPFHLGMCWLTSECSLTTQIDTKLELKEKWKKTTCVLFILYTLFFTCVGACHVLISGCSLNNWFVHNDTLVCLAVLLPEVCASICHSSSSN